MTEAKVSGEPKDFIHWSQVAPDGSVTVTRVQIAETQLEGRIATGLAVAVMTSDMLRQHMSDSPEAVISPRKIASLSCDIARELVAEYRRRGWHHDIPFAKPPAAMIANPEAAAPTREGCV